MPSIHAPKQPGMELFTATWRFVQVGEAGARGREPAVLSALHALQCWRLGHLGRAFRFVNACPFVWDERPHARLVHFHRDLCAETELIHLCHAHRVNASAVRLQQIPTWLFAEVGDAFLKLRRIDPDLADQYEKTRSERRRRRR